MADSRRHAVRRPGWWVLVISLSLAGSVAVVTATAAAVVLRVAQLVIIPARSRVESVTVLGVDRRAKTVTLRDHPDAVLPGRYSLYFSGDRGCAKVGGIVRFASGSVTRELIAEVRGVLRPQLPARMSAWFYDSPAELGYAWSEVTIETEWGPAPAWIVPAADSSTRWVIQVHGRGVDRREPLRAVPVFSDAGYSSLLLSYRNDGVGPASSDGRYALGDTEWRDVDAGIQFAIDHGAQEIVLMGWSMGGALVLQAATRSLHSRYLRGIVLDSPVVDWVRVLDHQAGSMRIPAVIRAMALRVISSSWGRAFTGQSESIDLDRLDFVRRAGELRLPILMLHSEADSYVPAAGSQRLAELRPDIVTFELFSGAGHTRLWNYDPERWTRGITAWLSRLR